MTRDDIFWLAQRLLMLWFFFKGITGIYAMGEGASSGSVAVPLIAAAVMFALTQKTLSEGKSEVHISLRKEDLLWVACKVFGLWALIGAADALGSVLCISFGAPSPPLGWYLPTVFVLGAIGAWLFFGDSPWLHGRKTRPPATE